MKRPSEDHEVGITVENAAVDPSSSTSSSPVPLTRFCRKDTSPARFASKAMRDPSGAHTGELSIPGSVVKRF
jgi:hypothetical protein